MSFDFRNLTARPKVIKFLINGENFNKDYNYDVIDSILYGNKYGQLWIDKLNLLNQDLCLENLIKIEKFKISIDKSLKERLISSIYIKPDVEYKFFNCNIELDRQNIPEDSYVKYENENTIVITSKELKDIDLLKQNKENLNVNAGMVIDTSNTKFNLKFKKIYTDESGQNISIEKEDEEININPYIEKMSIRDSNSSNSNNCLIDFEDEEKFRIVNMKDNKILNCQSSVTEYRKTYFNNALRPCFTKNGHFISLSNYDSDYNMYNIKVFKLNVNDRMKSEDSKYYTNNTINQYLYAFSQKLMEKKENLYEKYDVEKLSVSDYFNIISNYIGYLESSIDNTSIKRVKIRMSQEIETLKLFKILFLEYKSAFDERSRLARRNNMIKWLISTNQKVYEKKIIRCFRNEEKLIYSAINGRINDVIKFSGVDYTAIPCLVSQPNNSTRQSLMAESMKKWENTKITNLFPKEIKVIYEIISDNNPKVYDDKIKYFDWKSLFISLHKYTLNYKYNISELIRCHEERQIKNKIVFPLSNAHYININYLLIKLVGSIEKNCFYEKVLSHIIDSHNLFKGFSSHHVQYIIISTLLNVLYELYYRPLESNIIFVINYLKLLNFILFTRNIEELLINNDWRSALYLIDYSIIPDKTKESFKRDIMFKFADSDDEDYIEHNYANESIGYYYLNKFEIDKAIYNFEKAEDFSKAFEIDLFYRIFHKIIQNNIDNDLIDRMKFYASKGKIIVKWESHGKIIQDYLYYIQNYKIDQKNYNIKGLEVLIKKIETINGEIGYNDITLLCKNNMIKNMRKIYNELCKSVNSNDYHYAITPNINWVRNKNYDISLKNNELKESFYSVVDLKEKMIYLHSNK